jgi:osmotically-inducible protein OsmY
MESTNLLNLSEIEARVRCRLGGQVRHLRLRAHDEHLVLQGRARSYHARQEAEEWAAELSGCPDIVNEIEIA